MNCNTGEIVRSKDMSKETLKQVLLFCDGLAEKVSRSEQMRLLAKAAPFVAVDKSDAIKLTRMSKVRRKNWMRNRPCPCASGKKFKMCCWSKMVTGSVSTEGVNRDG